MTGSVRRIPRVIWSTFALAAICSPIAACNNDAEEQFSPPYPHSVLISSVDWARDSLFTAAPGSDLWPIAWAADGNLYTSWGDGGGFGGDNRRGRVSMGIARLAGSAAAFTAANINGGVGSEVPPTWDCANCGKTAGLISVDGVLYAWINMQGQVSGPVAPRSRLAWSSDFGKTWTFSDWFFPDPADIRFQPATFVHFGKDYTGARDRYVYSYGGRWIHSQGPENSLYLIRADRSRLRERSAWQVFAGLDGAGEPRWSSAIRSRRPVFTDPHGVNNLGLASVVYNRPLHRFILTVAHRTVRGDTRADAGRLGIFEAPTPWGPWSTVAYYTNWMGLGDHEALIYEIPAKWIGPEGKQFWMIFSSGDADSFNLVRGSFEPANAKAPIRSSGDNEGSSRRRLQP